MKNTLKNKNKNLKLTTLGFTLIELLAVIVILAIIALIATPIILGIVEDARKDSFMRSVELVIKTTDIDIFSKDYNDKYTYTIKDGVVSNLEVGVKNTDGMNGSIVYDTKGNDIYAINNGKYCVIKTTGMKKAEITDYVEGECVLFKITDEKYFTYEVESEYIISDKNACINFYVSEWDFVEEQAISICNNEPFEGDMPITDALELGEVDEEAVEILKEVGAIEEILGIEITGYSEEGPKNVIIPEEINGKPVVSIGSYAFSDKSLTSVVLPETLVRIRNSAFSTNLFTDITLPNSLEEIEDYAFCYTNLNQTSVNNITEINEYAYCTITDESCFTYEDAEFVEYEIIDVDACLEVHITEWELTENVATRSCNNDVFYWWGGRSLTEYLATEASQSEINDLKEAGAIKEANTSLEGIRITGYECADKEVVIPSEIDGEKVVTIGNQAFASLDLTSVALPDTVKLTEYGAFGMNKILNLKLSSNLETIGRNTFFGNPLNILHLPSNLKTIQTGAFGYVTLYDIILYENTQLQELGNHAFECLHMSEKSKVVQLLETISNGSICVSS